MVVRQSEECVSAGAGRGTGTGTGAGAGEGKGAGGSGGGGGGGVGLSLGELVGEPVEAFVQAVALRRTRGLDVPLQHHPSSSALALLAGGQGDRGRRGRGHLSVAEVVEAEFVGELSGGGGIGEVLLVGEDEEDRVPQLVLPQLTSPPPGE